MKRNSKKPDERRAEIISVAGRLFDQKGYEAVSIRDILNEINGAPGMFYYYFRSKQDVYIAAMEQFIVEKLQKKLDVIEDDSIDFGHKVEVFRSLIVGDVAGYAKKYNLPAEGVISDDAYKLWELMQMMNRMIKPYAKFMMQGIEEGKIKNNIGITEENAEGYATFILYGAFGMLYNDKFSKTDIHFQMKDIMEIITKFFY